MLFTALFLKQLQFRGVGCELIAQAAFLKSEIVEIFR
jgi:hypothetical protein